MNRKNLQKIVDALIEFTNGPSLKLYDKSTNCYLIVDVDKDGIITDVNYVQCPVKQFDVNIVEDIGCDHYCTNEYSEEHPFKKFINPNTYHERLHPRQHINIQRRFYRHGG